FVHSPSVLGPNPSTAMHGWFAGGSAFFSPLCTPLVWTPLVRSVIWSANNVAVDFLWVFPSRPWDSRPAPIRTIRLPELAMSACANSAKWHLRFSNRRETEGDCAVLL